MNPDIGLIRANRIGTASSAGTVDFGRISPELEAAFVLAALTLGTRAMKFRDADHRAIYRRQYARYFSGVSSDLPPIEHWPPRLHGRMTDHHGEDLPLFEKLAVMYIWWIDEHFRRS